MISNAMLMAAGLGIRLRPFTQKTPKPLLPVMGIPLAQFAMDLLGASGVRKIVANVHHLHETATRGLGQLDRHGAELHFSDERDLLLGSAGGMKRAQSLFNNEAFFLLNADVLCSADLNKLALRHSRLRARWGVWMTVLLHPSAPGDGQYREALFDEGTGLVAGFGSLGKGKPLFTGIAVVEEDALKQLPLGKPAETLPSIFEPAIRAGKLGFHLERCEWFDIGSPELWLETHLQLISRLETGQLPRAWRTRIEKANVRKAPLTWVSNVPCEGVSVDEWIAPAYWSSWDNSEALPPKKLGPNSVLYGGQWADISSNGIGYCDMWVTTQRNEACSALPTNSAPV